MDLTNSELPCNVCGETKYTENEGFYYCNECGTQSQHVRVMQVDTAFTENITCFATKHKISKLKAEKLQLTSWECFNYVLRGLVEELIELGAKDSVKLIALQLWSTYLRKIEVAFFSKKQTELPKLGTAYRKSDAKILYNHQLKRKRERKKKSESIKSSEISSSRKGWKRYKRQLDQTEYATTFSDSQSGLTQITSESSSSVTSTRPVRLRFSRLARRRLKKIMPKHHIRKHEEDHELNLTCHEISAIGNKLLKTVNDYDRVSRKIIYTILYLALNLSESELQLADVVRFMREGHLSTTKLQHFFPENIALDCSEIVKTFSCFSQLTILNSNLIRKNAFALCKFLSIRHLKLPNMYKLTRRYVHDLELPEEVGDFCERLLAIHPPKMNLSDSTYTKIPKFEVRAMAYIVFILKLMFGLDGSREKLISQSAGKVNAVLEDLNCPKKLFVFDDWVRYIEMRTIILTQSHLPTSLHFQYNVNTDKYLAFLKDEILENEEAVTFNTRDRLVKVASIFDELFHLHDDKPEIPIKFPSTLTPYESYMESIRKDSERISIPDFMYEDRKTLDIYTFLNPNRLKKMLKEKMFFLNIERISCNVKMNFVGLLKNDADKRFGQVSESRERTVRKTSYDITAEQWTKELRSKLKSETEISIFEKDTPTIDERTITTGKKPSKFFQRNKPVDRIFEKFDDLKSMHSFDVFGENNMQELSDTQANKPRKDLENCTNILEEVSDEEEIDENDFENCKEITLKVTNHDYWTIFAKSEALNVPQQKEFHATLPPTFLWLLKTCSKIVETEIIDLYQELLVIENQFMFALKPLNNFRNILEFRNGDKVNTTISMFVQSHTNLW